MNNPFESISKRLENIEGMVLDIAHPSFDSKPKSPNDDTILWIDEAAKDLGCNSQHVRKLVREKELPAYQHGKRLLFLKSDILNFLKKHRVNLELDGREFLGNKNAAL